ncbi:MAG: polysaccharide biosynthesis protein [Bacilli bacterium]|nr:polysaccharide biosynthesis protein [Bacilli bacterium]
MLNKTCVLAVGLGGWTVSRESFLRGALLLIIASITTKILGMVMQVIVNRLLGPEGFGLFRTVWPLLGLIFTLSTVGLPTALAKVIAEAIALGDEAKVRRAMRFSGFIVIVLSIIFSASLIMIAPSLSSKWLDPRSYPAVVALAIWVPIINFSWIVRNFYMGIQNQTHPSIAWIVETVARTAVTIPLVYWANQFGLKYAAAAVMTGIGIGELCGFLYMYWKYRRKDRHLHNLPPLEGKPETSSRTVRALAQIAVPTTFKNILGTMAYAAEPLILYAAFANVGVDKGPATRLYGSLGMAISLLLLPTVLSSVLSTVLVPAVSEAAALNNSAVIKRRLYQTIRETLMIGLPATILFLIMGHDVAVSLYRDPLAGDLLMYLAPICIFIYLREPLAGILQGLNKAGISTVVSLTGSAIRMACIYYFVSKPGLGIYGLADSTAIAAILSTILYFFFVKRYVSIYVDWADSVKLLTATALFAFIVYQTKMALSSSTPGTRVITALVIGFIVYLIALLLLRVIRPHTLEKIPKIGTGLAKLLRQIPILR